MTETQTELILGSNDIEIPLTDTEQERFFECESIIKKGLGTFLEVGAALAEIRDNRLYRETHDTFEKYCKEKWDIGRSYAYKQIESCETVNLLKEKCGQLSTLLGEDPSKNNIENLPCCDETLAELEEKCLTCEHRKAMTNRAFKGVRIPWGNGKCTRPEGLCMKEPEKADLADHIEIVLPMNEAQARKLNPLKDPDDLMKAWGLVLKELKENPKAKLTAALIGKTVKEVAGTVKTKKIKETKEAVNATILMSNLFKRQYQVMLDILSEERNSGWKGCSRKETVKWLKNLVKIAESEE